jgi:catechol 2,3-dioxygenase-like lactoylglutathione lyase family enzyme
MGRILTLICIFPCRDIENTAKFYTEKLGFRAVPYLDVAEPHICLYRDKVEIVLTKTGGRPFRPNHESYGNGEDAYFITDTQAELQDEFKEKGVKIVRPLRVTDYQNREFIIEDCDGRWLAFGIKEG